MRGVGRKWEMWRKSVYDFFMDVSGDQFIFGTLVDIVSSATVHIGVVYASNHVSERRNLWSQLIDVCVSWQLSGDVLGDFNAIRSSLEDFGGYPSLREMDKFDGALLEADLVEMGVTEVKPPPTYRYFSHWMEADGFIDTTRSVWRRSEDVSHMVAKQIMEATQAELERDSVFESMCSEVARATEVFWLVARLEEASLRQKAKVRWLELGDMNTTFFHRCVHSRHSCSGLFTIVDAGGTRYSYVEVAVELCRGSLGSQPMRYRDLTAQIEDIVQFSWFDEGVKALGRLVSQDEIQKALFSMMSGKAPRPDGFSVDIYRAAECDWG
ncbi:uncharacterized protein LOC120076053 [Benincasa hispida]|uniref:uncharacterized protein LOC120076053 n=1 Tax=Benincasa hispida TaxID=102211 RepID=UPI001901D7B4|nr:uncharacterized protein LOC120076053 [Benincasa hispida]